MSFYKGQKGDNNTFVTLYLLDFLTISAVLSEYITDSKSPTIQGFVLPLAMLPVGVDAALKHCQVYRETAK